MIRLAQITGLALIPYSCHLDWRLHLKSWDRFQIPIPFSRCSMTFGEPIYVQRDATDMELNRAREHLQDVLLLGTRGN